jgi:hypothetical protein
VIATTPEKKQRAIPLVSHWSTNGTQQLKKAAALALETLAK